MDNDRGAQYLHAGSASLLKDVLHLLREAQGASPSSPDPFPGRGELARITMKHMGAFILSKPQGICFPLKTSSSMEYSILPWCYSSLPPVMYLLVDILVF